MPFDKGAWIPSGSIDAGYWKTFARGLSQWHAKWQNFLTTCKELQNRTKVSRSIWYFLNHQSFSFFAPSNRKCTTCSTSHSHVTVPLKEHLSLGAISHEQVLLDCLYTSWQFFAKKPPTFQILACFNNTEKKVFAKFLYENRPIFYFYHVFSQRCVEKISWNKICLHGQLVYLPNIENAILCSTIVQKMWRKLPTLRKEE